MPIRQQFGNWTGFVKAMGLNPLPSVFSPQAREASIKARKGKKSGAWKGGSDYIENIQPLCRSCNSKKHNNIYENPELLEAKNG